MVKTTTATEFQRKFGQIRRQAGKEPVEITRHGRRAFVLLSADRYDGLAAAARRTPDADVAPVDAPK